MIQIDETRCVGCGICAETCPTGAIRLVEGIAQVDPNLCRGCEVCLEACTQGAIISVQEPAKDIKPVPVSAPISTSPRPMPVTTPAAHRNVSWLGAALAFVGREVVPRVATAFLDAWDRRQAARLATVPPAPSARQSMPVQSTSATGRSRRGAGRHRRRLRQRGRR